MNKKKYVLGIDGGGTRTNAVLAAMDGNVVAESQSEATNLQVVGEKKAAQVILKLINDCCQKIESNASEIRTIVMGLAGGGRTVDKNLFLEEFTSTMRKNKIEIPQIIVETDARIALEAAFASSYGIVVIAGTGSIALAKSEDGKIYRAGGYGRILGDEGSGHTIGLKALNMVIRSLEGRGEKSILTKFAFEHFGVSSIDDLVTKIYRESADIASFAPKVFKAESEFDRVAHNILFTQANELADLARFLISQTHPTRKIPVALMGGLLESENVYSKMVKERIARSLPQVFIQKPKFPAAFGAVIIGLKAFEFK